MVVIGCYTGCQKNITGICQGYEITCNRHYCTDHHLDLLCLDCANRLRQELAIEEAFEIYYKAAKEEENYAASIEAMNLIILASEAGISLIIYVCAFIAISLMNDIVKFILAPNTIPTMTPILALVPTFLAILCLVPRKLSQSLWDTSDLVKPNPINLPSFRQFYEKYRTLKAQNPRTDHNVIKSLLKEQTKLLFLPGRTAYPLVYTLIKTQDLSAVKERIVLYIKNRPPQPQPTAPHTAYIHNSTSTTIDARNSQGFINQPRPTTKINQTYTKPTRQRMTQPPTAK